MTERNFTEELLYTNYVDMENGDDIETIDYRELILIIGELCGRIEQLEQRLDKQEEYQQEQNENWNHKQSTGQHIHRKDLGCPDGIDYADFLCGSLGECFEEIIKWEVLNGMGYVNDWRTNMRNA